MKDIKNGLVWDRMGNRRWYKDDLLHRVFFPAVILLDGTENYYLNGVLHRDNGPACEWSDGTKEWYKEGNKCKAEDVMITGLVELSDGDKLWYKDGVYHREDGPAIERKSGVKAWYIKGELVYSNRGWNIINLFEDLPESFKHSIIKYELLKETI
jgi:hypothetical protein